MAREYTAEQLNAIYARGGSILVSAAAGSGKTSVLVERVIQRVLDEQNPCDVDKLLVVTFSNAAAAEMKSRVQTALTQMLQQNPDNLFLKRQQMLLPRANISTVHAFCFKLIREHFQMLPISPNVRIAEESELSVLKTQAVEEIIETFYEGEQSDAFEQVAEMLSSFRDDRKLISTIFWLYDFVCSHPFPERWMQEKVSYYREDLPLEQSVWGEKLFSIAESFVSHAYSVCEQALIMIEGDDKLTKAYHPAFSDDFAMLNQLDSALKAKDYEKLHQILWSFSFTRLGALRGYDDDQTKELLKSARESVKGIHKELRESLFCCSKEEYLQDIRYLQPRIDTLFQVVQAFSDRYAALKQEKNIIDFADLEHFAIQLLAVPTKDGFSQTMLAKELSSRFAEILVDEYQDTNEAQDTIFQVLSRHGENLFMVGDVKQSIYRFRQAMPEIFLKKNEQYQLYDGKTFPAKILLHKNFRSRKQVTDTINFFFEQLMSKEIGEITYDASESLIAGAQYEETDRDCMSLHVLDSGESEEKAIEFEADYIAQMIHEILHSKMKVRGEDGQMRGVQPGDICILLRSIKGKAQVYADAMERYQTPACRETDQTFFDSREIAAVLSFLKVLDNPLDDISMMTLLTSEIMLFDFDDLAKLRLLDKYAPLYLNLTALAKEGEEKWKRVAEMIDRFRLLAQTMSVAQLLQQIYEETLLETIMESYENGAVRKANLHLLFHYAQRFESAGYKGLCSFLRFLARLEDQGSDLSAANTTVSDDAVQIMSIHKSKGLEFPICILADLGKRFNKMDLNSQTLVHGSLGFSAKRKDDRNCIYPTLPYEMMKLELENNMLSEELRILYVAMTRAKEYLHLVITYPDVQKKIAKLSQNLTDDLTLSPYSVREASGYGDWILSAALRHPDAAELRKISPIPILPISADSRISVLYQASGQTVMPVGLPARCEDDQEAEPPDLATLDILAKRDQFCYPYQKEMVTPTKLAVSQVTEQEVRGQYAFTARPRFETGQAFTPAQRGTAMHQFLQFVDFKACEVNPFSELERLVGQRYFTAQQAEILDLHKLNRFFESKLYHRIKQSAFVSREQRFLAQLDYGLCTGDEKDSGIEVVVQGVCDLLFEEDGKLIIVDYKTDHVKQTEILKERYMRQLTVYRHAIEKVMHKTVSECVLYSIELGKSICVYQSQK